MRRSALKPSGICARSASLCNDASFNPELGAGGRSGDTVDLALLVLAAKGGIDVRALSGRCPRVPKCPSPPNDVLRLPSTAAEGLRLHAKGRRRGARATLRRHWRRGLAGRGAMAARGHRVLAIATKDVQPRGRAHRRKSRRSSRS